MMTNSTAARDAEEVVRVRGISRPEDIDLKAIAKTLYADVEELPLVGCEARIIGNEKRATISVNSISVSVLQTPSFCFPKKMSSSDEF